jgi:glycosyltransferase involved in cell wall biosynthesis
MEFDCILFQDRKQFAFDQWEILSAPQRRLPRIFIEHNAPEPHPTDSLHPLDDPEVTLVHVTQYNRLMWHNQVPKITVINHGIRPSASVYTGEIAGGITVINHLFERGRKLGGDVFRQLQSEVPLHWIGMGEPLHGGLGEILHPELPEFISRYRFFFNPIRHTSLALSVLEAMMIGLPVVTLATTEYATLIRDGVNGFCSNDPDRLSRNMQNLIADPVLAREIGARGRKTVEKFYNIDRFVQSWTSVFEANTNLNVIKGTVNEKDNVYQ